MAATLITGKHWRYISAKPAARWALRWVYLLLFAAVCMPWLAYHKPLYCKIEGKTQWPVWQEWAAGYGLVRLDPGFFRRDWKQQTYQRVIWPLIPYSSSTQDLNNSNFRGPFE